MCWEGIWNRACARRIFETGQVLKNILNRACAGRMFEVRHVLEGCLK